MLSLGVGMRVDSTLDLSTCSNKVWKAVDFPKKASKKKILMLSKIFY